MLAVRTARQNATRNATNRITHSRRTNPSSSSKDLAWRAVSSTLLPSSDDDGRRRTRTASDTESATPLTIRAPPIFGGPRRDITQLCGNTIWHRHETLLLAQSRHYSSLIAASPKHRRPPLSSFEKRMYELTLRVFFSSNAPPKTQMTSTTPTAPPPLNVTKISTDQSQSATGTKQGAAPKTTVPPSPITPPAASTESSLSSMISHQKLMNMIASVSKSVANLLAATPGVMWYYLTNPKKFREKMIELKEHAKKEAHHYWMGSKLLAADVRIARQMLMRTLQGSSLTRRERKQLLRTTADLFRLVPMSMFVLIPFMEFALPFALKLFPNMLPSTFQDSLQAEESMKRELQTRIAMAGFFQETLQSLANEKKKQAQKSLSDDCPTTPEKEKSAITFLSFLESAREGKALSPEIIIKFAKYFKDELTLDNMSRMQLVSMCKYMGIPPYGADSLLQFQLRHKIRSLKEDDQRILWEGIDSLTKMELREACQERGMRSTGLSKAAYKNALQQWLDLSVNKDMPIALLIMSRTFYLRDEMEKKIPSVKGDEEKTVTSIADAISGLEKGVVNEVILEVAHEELNSNQADVMKIKLEVLNQQNELIKAEYEERERKKKALEEKERAEKEKEQEKLERAEKEKEQEKEQLELMLKEDKLREQTIADAMAREEKEILAESAGHSGEQVAAPLATDEMYLGFNSSQKDRIPTETPTIPIETATAADPTTADETKDTTASTPLEEDEEEDDEDETELSAEEMEAISHLVTPNAVESERMELERIKANMNADHANDDDKEKKQIIEDEALQPSVTLEKSHAVIDESTTTAQFTETPPPGVDATVNATSPPPPPSSPLEPEKTLVQNVEPMTPEEADKLASDTIAAMDSDAAALASATVEETPTTPTETATTVEEDEKLNRSIKRLQSKVEDMIGKIEKQLSDVEVKIGDKLHLLDKDGDGILTKDEMVAALQHVLKRSLSYEEAMEIASSMDENDDGMLTVTELSKWLETNLLMKLVEEGRDADVDKLIKKFMKKYKEGKEQEEDSVAAGATTEETQSPVTSSLKS